MEIIKNVGIVAWAFVGLCLCVPLGYIAGQSIYEIVTGKTY